jgi:hypothetical protein
MSTVSILTIRQLKSRLVHIAKRSRSSMAPLLWQLRERIKAQGKKGEGFGVWCEKHLDISRRTADRWADEYARKHSLKTFRQMTKSRPKQNDKTADGKVTIQVSWVATKAEEEQFIEAMGVLGQEAQPLIYKTVIQAAKERQHAGKRARSAKAGAY